MNMVVSLAHITVTLCVSRARARDTEHIHKLGLCCRYSLRISWGVVRFYCKISMVDKVLAHIYYVVPYFISFYKNTTLHCRCFTETKEL
jgi:hypothetical protein